MATMSNRRAIGSSENVDVKVTMAKKRPPLTNLTNQGRGSVDPTSTMVPCASSKGIKPTKKKSVVSSISSTSFLLSAPPNTTPNVAPPTNTYLPKTDVLPSNKLTLPKSESQISNISVCKDPSFMEVDVSPCSSGESSLSVHESTSSCGSLNSPEVEYLDQNDVAAVGSIERKTSNCLWISDHGDTTETVCKREILAEMEFDKVCDVDDKYSDPQYCATIACDIYKHLRASEMKKRASTDFMEKVQNDINANMRSILVDWLVEVAEEYRLVPDTLYLTVNYIDRYLSGNAVNRQRLQLLGVSCMMIASKYEEICAPQVEEFCYITDNTYFRDEVLDMESAVLNYLKFEMTAPTTKCFLRRFIQAAQATTEIASMTLECLANYIAELSLLEYDMLQYAPSLIAASAVFLAKYILSPSQPPWNSTLKHYTLYEPSDLHNCVKALQQFCFNCSGSSLPAIREKYSQHKYKFVAKKYCPPSIPPEYFQN